MKTSGLLASGMILNAPGGFAFGKKEFESKRPPLSERKFTSDAVEEAISRIKKQIADPELAWVFENCFLIPWIQQLILK